MLRIRGQLGLYPRAAGKRALGIGSSRRNFVSGFAQHLPDVDMPINYMDESRILVPFDEIAKLEQKEKENRKLIPAGEVTT
ncbi:glycosyltransferase family 90 [Trichoderma cornu-damae]|uniref:Glycosyltransferase family 90 n=1 Tax=Trichoderma cornu-damae TaxID=654480 RepID=A0A9P8QQR1_9HYPO|nr:glycosyltransferase family 90 [Trichoderma cornu-damae]